MNKFFTFIIGFLLVTLVGEVKVNAQCSSWIPRDSVFGDSAFGYVHFAFDSSGSIPVAPYYRNDDGVTNAIVLPFHFCFWGRQLDTVYINNNGTISFGQQYSSFLPNPRDSFPLHNFEMIAPFWSDVYTRFPTTPGSNVVIYKIQAHYMIVQWDSVAYYSGENTKFNSFQVIISDGTDPIIPAGNNVSFAYRQMQWTTGNASDGVGGFGGHPANVGGNEGDDIRYLRIGLFASPGNLYFGQFPPPPNYDEVGWLDNKSFLFNLCSGSIAPIVSGISPCDTFKVCVGDSISIPLYYFCVIQGDCLVKSCASCFIRGKDYFQLPGLYR